MKAIFIVISAILIAGCHPTIEYKVIAPEDAWIVDCAKEPPPDITAFMKSDDVGKMYMMTKSYEKQVKNIDLCNVRLQQIRTWKKEQEQRAH